MQQERANVIHGTALRKRRKKTVAVEAHWPGPAGPSGRSGGEGRPATPVGGQCMCVPCAMAGSRPRSTHSGFKPKDYKAIKTGQARVWGGREAVIAEPRMLSSPSPVPAVRASQDASKCDRARGPC